MAQPPGKRLQSLTLLSGGEQALTAVALIFGLFLTNPAPICVLDEVDAPLDDANIDRFCGLLDRMTRETDTRYLIVTHNAVTMSRMHRLFGVTMIERGSADWCRWICRRRRRCWRRSEPYSSQARLGDRREAVVEGIAAPSLTAIRVRNALHHPAMPGGPSPSEMGRNSHYSGQQERPSITVTHPPPSTTRSPSSRQVNRPPRALACSATKASRPSFSVQ